MKIDNLTQMLRQALRPGRTLPFFLLPVRRTTHTRHVAWLACLLVVCLQSACTYHRQYRTDASNERLPSYVESEQRIDKESAYREKVGSLSIEDYPEFSLGFVEFDDQGRYWNRFQVDKLIAHVRKDPAVKRNGAVLVVFAHGWFHNAGVRDQNVRQVRLLLGALSADESRMPAPRKVVGVYVGWRGLSATINPFKAFSFWARKDTASRIGRGDLVELLSRLDSMKQDISKQKTSPGEQKSRLIIVGHSFGGTAVYSAVGSIFKERAIKHIRAVKDHERDGPPHAELIEGFGDVVLLVNPAFEALIYSGIAEATKNFAAYHPQQTTLLATVGAENDSATGVAFPIGQFFGTSLQKTKNTEERALIRTSVGHYRSYFTDELMVINPPPPGTPIEPKQIQPWQPPLVLMNSAGNLDLQKANATETLSWRDFLPPNRTWNIKQLNARRPPNDPFLVITAPKEIVNGHSGIWGVSFREFLRDFIIAQDLAKQSKGL